MPATATAAPQMSYLLNRSTSPSISSAMEQYYFAADALSIMDISGARAEPTGRKPLCVVVFNTKTSVLSKDLRYGRNAST